MKLPTASSLSRVMACPASGVIPRVVEPAGDAAERGTAIHAFIATALTRGHDAAMSECPEQYENACRAIDFNVFPEGVECEVALGYRPDDDTSSRYVLKSHRDYPDDGLFHVTIDLVGMRDAQTVWVADIKTGDHDAASDSWQLKLGALAACSLAGVTRAEVEFLKLTPAGTWLSDRHVLEAEDIHSARRSLLALKRWLASYVPGTAVDYAVGDHCRYCPAIRVCPAQTALVRAFDEEITPLSLTGALAALTPEKLGSVYERLTRYEDVLKKVKDSLRAIVAATGPVPLPDGRSLDLVASSRRKARDGAVATLLELFGERAAPAFSVLVSGLTPEMAATLAARGQLTVEEQEPSLKPVGKKLAKGKEAKA